MPDRAGRLTAGQPQHVYVLAGGDVLGDGDAHGEGFVVRVRGHGKGW